MLMADLGKWVPIAISLLDLLEPSSLFIKETSDEVVPCQPLAGSGKRGITPDAIQFATEAGTKLLLEVGGFLGMKDVSMAAIKVNRDNYIRPIRKDTGR